MKKKLLLFCGTIMIAWSTLFGAMVTPANAASNCNENFLLFKTWYSGLSVDGNCNIKSDNFQNDGMAKSIWIIVLNIMFDISVAIGILATVFIMYGGYLYIMSGGDPGKVTKGKTTIRNAVIGIVVAVGAGVIIGTIETILTV